MHQGFRIYFVWNPRSKTTEAYSFTLSRSHWKYFQFYLKSTGRAVSSFWKLNNLFRILIFGPCCFIQLIIPQFCGRLKNLLYDKHVRVALQYYNGFKIQKKIDRFISKYLLRFQLSKTKWKKCITSIFIIQNGKFPL